MPHQILNIHVHVELTRAKLLLAIEARLSQQTVLNHVGHSHVQHNGIHPRPNQCLRLQRLLDRTKLPLGPTLIKDQKSPIKQLCLPTIPTLLLTPAILPPSETSQMRPRPCRSLRPRQDRAICQLPRQSRHICRDQLPGLHDSHRLPPPR